MHGEFTKGLTITFWAMTPDLFILQFYFEGIEDDEDLEEADLETAINAIKKKGGNINQKKSSNVENKQDKKEVKDKKATQKSQQKTTIKSLNSEGSEESSSEASSDSVSESDFDENEHYPYRKQKKNDEKEGFEEVPAQKISNNVSKKRPILTPEELALGEKLISSKKCRRDMEDAAWNRYMFDDRDK